MKKLLLSLLALGFALTASAAQTSDEVSIKNTIEAHKTALDAVDYKAYMSQWAKVPYASFLIFGEQYVGDALWAQMDKVWATRKPVKVNNVRTNWTIHRQGEAAFVTFNQRVENLDTKAVSESVEARYMEKVNGQWKIVSVTAIFKPAK